MTKKTGTNGLFVVGIGLIILAGAMYGILTLLGVSFAIAQVSAEAGASLWLILALPAIATIGFLMLVAKVVLDRLNSKEDDYYSRNIDK